MWKGDLVEYRGLHNWINRNYGSPSICERCGSGNKKKYDWANITGEYKRERINWIRLCRGCHLKNDYTEERMAKVMKIKRDKKGRFLK